MPASGSEAGSAQLVLEHTRTNFKAQITYIFLRVNLVNFLTPRDSLFETLRVEVVL